MLQSGSAEELLTWWPETTLLDVDRCTDRIAALSVLHAGETSKIKPKIVIDGSDLGDLMARAEVPFRWGWEPREQWNEPSAPSQEQLSQRPVLQSAASAVSDVGRDGPADAGRPAGAASGGTVGTVVGSLDAFGLERTLTYGRLPGGW